MEKWQDGDIASFEAFFREHQGQVYRNAFLITGDRDDAEDVLQSVFTAVWKSKHTFNPDRGKVSTWLHRITVNECMRNVHKKRREVLRVAPEQLESMPANETVGTGFDDLVPLLGRLDPRHRAVLVLRYYSDLSYDEIATALDVPLGTVKSRINHGLKAMRSMMKDRETLS